MGSFVFKWDHPASEVYVTGTFDDWSKSEKLDRVGDGFSKDVTLPSADAKIYYKFVVDGNWVTDHTAPQENDASGNLNNVLTTDRINKHSSAAAGIMSGVTPQSTTAGLAKDVPVEKSSTGSSDLPGAFPETPAAELQVNPLPAFPNASNPTSLDAGEKVPPSSNFTTNTITSGVRDDPELVEKLKSQDQAKEGEQTFGVAPLPAFAGGVNPITLAPGEKVPEASSLTNNTIHSNAREDPELVQKLLKAQEKEQGHESADAGPFTQSAGPQSTTAALAADVPLESTKVPQIVKESQKAAGVEPEASAVAEEVREKSQVEQELESKVTAAPSTSEGIAGQGTIKSEKSVSAGEAAAAVSGAAVAVGGAAVAATSGLFGKLPTSVTSKLPVGVQESINNINTDSDSKLAASRNAPVVVQDSIAESGRAPEAAANDEAIIEKKQVEKELLHDVKKVTSAGEPAPHASAEPSSKSSGILAGAQTAVTPSTAASNVPEPVKESISDSQRGPEAAANKDAVAEKQAFEKELLKEVKKETSTGESAPKIADSTPAPVEKDAQYKDKAPSTPSKNLTAPVAASQTESRDVSPGTVPGSRVQTHDQTEPVVTTGVASSTTAATSTPSKAAESVTSTPSKPTAPTGKTTESPASASASQKKKNRASAFFSKIKSKLSDK